MRSLSSTCLLLGVLTLLAQACGRNPPRPNVILISFDTFRADMIDPSLTPSLSRLAEESIVFKKAFVPYPHTLTSHATLLTGVYPGVHRVFPEGQRLSETISTLATFLASAGYRTTGLVTSEWLKAELGFARDFDHYQVLPHELTYAERVNAEALLRLDMSREDKGPVFLFLHYYDAHSDFKDEGVNTLPYYSPPEFREDLELEENEFCGDTGLCSTGYLMQMDQERVALPRDRIEKIIELYRRGIAALDQEMGVFFEQLRSRGLYDESLIIVTSDHGEEFREHGRFIHSQPYDETTSVPLLIKLPNSEMAGVTVGDPVENVDVLPTLLDHLAIEKPAYLQGRNLLALISNETENSKAVLSQDSVTFTRYSLRDQDFRFISDLRGGRTELYELAPDPGERVNLAGERGDLVRRFEQQLIARLRANRDLARELNTESTSSEGVFSPEERANLKSLGYLD